MASGSTLHRPGDFLGDMTDELDGNVITKFVSGDAKNYGYTAGKSGV